MSIMKTLTINGETYNITPVVPASSVTLSANAWAGEGGHYHQVVDVPDVTPHTKVDLQPNSEQLAEFHYKVLSFVAENNYGVVTVYAIGDKPTGDYTIQVTKTEVEGTGVIKGNTVGTTMPRPDWNQDDPNAADYIKNKPDLSNIGGKGTIYVVLNEETGKASHTSSEIFDNFEKYNFAVILGREYIPIVRSSVGVAEFSSYENDQDYVRGVQIFSDGSYAAFQTDVITRVILDDEIGDISSALDEIREYAESLINGGGSV